MTLANYLNAQTYNTRKDPNLVINQMDRCQENDSKQDIELDMFLPLNDNDDKEEEKDYAERRHLLQVHITPQAEEHDKQTEGHQAGAKS